MSFSFLHAANPGFNVVAAVNTFLIGIFFGAVVLGSGHLWSAIGLHAGWNFSLGCFVSLPVSGLSMPGLLAVRHRETGEFAELFFGGDYGPEGGLAVTLLVLMGLSWALPRALDRWRVDQWGWKESEEEPRAAQDVEKGLCQTARVRPRPEHVSGSHPAERFLLVRLQGSGVTPRDRPG
jgi:hypothetical protein